MTNKQDGMFKIIKNIITNEYNHLKFKLILFLVQNSKFISTEAKHRMINDYSEFMLQKNVTDRWSADMNSDSFLSKNIRPMVLIFLIVATVLLIFIDSSSIN